MSPKKKSKAPGKLSRKAYYTKEDLKKIRKAIIAEKASIIEELMKIKSEALNKSIKDASGDLSGYSFHMADMATDLYDREFLLELAEGERETLYSLDEALKRIEDGSYGKCERCGYAITKQRLKAMP